MEVNIKTSWKELTYGEFQQIIQIKGSDIPESYKLSNLIAILTGLTLEEVENLPITFFKKLADKAVFLTEEPPTIPHKNKYTINGHKYILRADVNKISTAQYMDYSNYMQMDPVDYSDLMSVWLVPEGHSYGDGYDLNEVKKDIDDMSFLDAQAVAFFFKSQLVLFIKILKGYLKKMMKKKKVSQEKISEVLTPLSNMVSSQ